MGETLDMEEVIDRISEYEGWAQEGPWLRKMFEFEDFDEAIGFVNEIAEEAEELNHHPEIVVREYNKVVLSITSHDEGGITERDFEFVDRVEERLE